jgi:galactose mutarotase-like enzyme
VSPRVPDRRGTLGDVVLGFDSLAGYVASSPYFGAVVGRYGNRVAKGRFTLACHTYSVAINNGPNALHDCVRGFYKVDWTADTPFDFTTVYAIGVRINQPRQQLRFGGGYDHNFVLVRAETGVSLAVILFDSLSGRTLTVHATAPGV